MHNSISRTTLFCFLNLFAGFTNINLANYLPLNTKVSTKAKAVKYSEFGAKGDGKTDDMAAIVATHAYANSHNLKVEADANAIYYIGGKDLTAIIQTDTDFGEAIFLIDDTAVENRNQSIFLVSSKLQAYDLTGIKTLKKNQAKLNLRIKQTSLISVSNANVKQYIRFGLNQNNGTDLTDIFLVNKNGKIAKKSPILSDFDDITEIKALAIDEKTLRISGGIFKTIANNAPANYTYYSRNIAIKRSNVIVSNMAHHLLNEGEQGAPYGGFIHISDCCFVKVENCVLTGHKTYSTIGSAGKPVAMGSYDLLVNRAIDISFVNCTQTNDISDPTYWGIMGSNFCKNLLYDACHLSRFDAHQGVANATIRKSTLGHMGINAIGSGTFLVEQCTIKGGSIVNLRSDYGSTWEGKLLIRDCTFIPRKSSRDKINLINGYNSGQHDFGYTCSMPELIEIKNLLIDDSEATKNYQGPAIFADFNPEKTSQNYVEKFPFNITNKVTLKHIKTTSGKPLRISDNTYMFDKVLVEQED